MVLLQFESIFIAYPASAERLQPLADMGCSLFYSSREYIPHTFLRMNRFVWNNFGHTGHQNHCVDIIIWISDTKVGESLQIHVWLLVECQSTLFSILTVRKNGNAFSRVCLSMREVPGQGSGPDQPLYRILLRQPVQGSLFLL